MPKPHRTGFISYAHADARIVDRFLDLMQPRCAILRDLEIDHWSDRRILAGEGWEAELTVAIDSSDFGLLCVTPRFLASKYATAVELPALLRRGMVIPVVLEDVDLALADLQGLQDLQLFRYRPPGSTEHRAFGDCAGASHGRFCDALVAQMVQRLRPRAPA
jgi:hypothetical protein